MNKYGSDNWQDHRFTLAFEEVERRGQWLDVHLELHPEEGETLPEELHDPSVYVICNLGGAIVQIILLDEGCDCEYQFTPGEKEKIARFLEEHGSAEMDSLLLR
ncbi:hypothetical protein ACI48J_10255 [Paenibacillus chitinolyticus]|uniref:hypothetical protein n=1 Tax=Paenibacillus chitinolyticus TaxID=79263 RepID=UPI002DBF2008|nr:hypothetical protein [Paenibacillus chitinolyticus]MEC0248273.1 hypothetical protein [Paenibacillus chitinolyticus]